MNREISMHTPPGFQENVPPDLPSIAYILAFLIGVLLFLLFGEPLLGAKPEPIWLAGLMGLSVSAIVFWAWDAIHTKDDNDD